MVPLFAEQFVFEVTLEIVSPVDAVTVNDAVPVQELELVTVTLYVPDVKPD